MRAALAVGEVDRGHRPCGHAHRSALVDSSLAWAERSIRRARGPVGDAPRPGV